MTNKITGTTETQPDGLVVIHAEADGREVSFGPFDRRELLTALRAEPDETDYQEVIAENERLGKRLSEKVSEGHRIRGAIGLGNMADTRLVLARIQELTEEAEKDDQEPEEGLYSPRDDQDQIDRSWALEKAGEVLGRLAAVGALPKDWAGVPVVAVAEWILTGEPVDRG